MRFAIFNRIGDRLWQYPTYENHADATDMALRINRQRPTVGAYAKAIEQPISEKLEEMVEQLEELKKGGWIVFSSPSPSSTEAMVKQAILKTIENLQIAIDYEKSLER